MTKKYFDKFTEFKKPIVVGVYEKCMFYTLDDKFVEEANRKLEEEIRSPFVTLDRDDAGKLVVNPKINDLTLISFDDVLEYYKPPKGYKVNDIDSGIDNYDVVYNIINKMFLNIERKIGTEIIYSSNFFFFSGMYARSKIFTGCENLVRNYDIDPEQITIFTSSENQDVAKKFKTKFNVIRGCRANLSKVVNEYLPSNMFMEVEGNHYLFDDIIGKQKNIMV
ncbi:hypothetical protein KY334_03110 [Candidatus Woesearchaeota archaeon]|nr:hypothetical protein [Candidatus Woesearchaeota archaeon]